MCFAVVIFCAVCVFFSGAFAAALIEYFAGADVERENGGLLQFVNYAGNTMFISRAFLNGN